jgi:hypothetical protein
VFGRGRRERAAEEAAREATRRDLLTKLAQRPENICPFLGLADERTGYVDGVSDEHRCYAFGDPATLSAEQQTRVCQERGYGNCPRYLRGVLVIPTEELEALRRPRPEPAAPPPTRAPRRRRLVPILLVAALIVLVAAGGAGAYLLLGTDGIASTDGSPTPTVAPTVEPTPNETPAGTPTPVPTEAPTAAPDPTPAPVDQFRFYEVSVSEGDYTLYAVNGAGEITGQRGATFSRNSQAQVEEVDAPNGTKHWRTTNGAYTGLSYIYPDSGDFRIRAVYERPDGGRSSEVLPEDEI